jgi:uncharacterized protein (DUF1800 family)
MKRRAALSVGVGTAAAWLAGCAAQGSGQIIGTKNGVLTSIGPTDASLALHLHNRLGYGARPGDIEQMKAIGAGAWLQAQLAPASIAEPADLIAALDAMPVLHERHAPTLEIFARRQADALSPALTESQRAAAQAEVTGIVQRVQGQARQARLMRAAASNRQLEEVLVEFWFNHFNVFAGKETVRVTAGFYEAEAIRPYVLGRFRDLLGATARHPAMLNYLDNWQSVASGFALPPGTPLPPGFVMPRGPNENYARELLELHTLGVDGGYTQADVSELARVFTGWSFDRRNPGPSDAFRFYPARHDNGPKRLLGLEVPGRGQKQGEWALDLLASHPATARHIGRKLAASFVADEPPPALVERLATRFSQTDGDLREVMRTLILSPEFLDPSMRGAKFKTPYQYTVSAVRACAMPLGDPRQLGGAVARMGMPIFLCPTPDGWRDSREAWLNPEGLRQRAEFAIRLGGQPGRSLTDALSASLSAGAQSVMAGLPAKEQVSMALASPDFMRR